jgi:hypothetical protein
MSVGPPAARLGLARAGGLPPLSEESFVPESFASMLAPEVIERLAEAEVRRQASPGVCLSFLFREDCKGWFTSSLVNLIAYDARYGQHILGPRGDTIAVQSSPRPAEGRNKIIDMFAVLEQEPEWLLMTDDDMVFDPNVLEHMLAVAHPEKVPILGGLCFAGGRVHDPYPTIYRSVQKDGYSSIEQTSEYPRDALVQVGATGGAFLLVHRGALAAMKKAYGKTQSGYPNPYPWFQDGVVGPEGEGWGEDTAFCIKATSIGIPVHVHTGIKIGHIKSYVLDETFYDNWLDVKARDEAEAKTNGHDNRAARRRKAREPAK